MSYQQHDAETVKRMMERMWQGNQQAANPFSEVFRGASGSWRQQQRSADVDRGEIQMTKSPDGVYRRA